MASVVQANHKLRITAVMNHSDQAIVENVFHVLCTTTPTGDDTDVMTDMAAWLDNAYDEIDSLMSNQLNFVEVRGFDVSADAPLPVVAWPALVTGGSATDRTAFGVAALIVFRTLKARVLGRKFIPALTEAVTEGNDITNTFITALVSWAIVIFAGPGGSESGGTYEYRIYDKLNIARPITDFVVRSKVAYQRRRAPGRGI